MMTAMRTLSLLAWICVTSCGFPKVPDESKGDISVGLRNGLPEEICSFSMSPRGAPQPGQNWLNTSKLSLGNSYVFHVKPGEYAVSVAGCGPSLCRGSAS